MYLPYLQHYCTNTGSSVFVSQIAEIILYITGVLIISEPSKSLASMPIQMILVTKLWNSEDSKICFVSIATTNGVAENWRPPHFRLIKTLQSCFDSVLCLCITECVLSSLSSVHQWNLAAKFMIAATVSKFQNLSMPSSCLLFVPPPTHPGLVSHNDIFQIQESSIFYCNFCHWKRVLCCYHFNIWK